MSSSAKARKEAGQHNKHTRRTQLQWISLEAKLSKKHTWSRLRKNATCWESVRKCASVLNFCIDNSDNYIVNVVKVRSPIISPLECAHIFEEQQLSRRSSLRHQRGKECHICLAGAEICKVWHKAVYVAGLKKQVLNKHERQIPWIVTIIVNC